VTRCYNSKIFYYTFNGVDVKEFWTMNRVYGKKDSSGRALISG